jgi:HEAT repeat protein
MRINVLTLGILLAADLLAQGEGMQPEGFPDIGDPCCIAGGVPRTIEQMLERRGVQLTVQALVNALLDPRPVVRSLAAEKLAQDKEKDAVPAIVEAFSRETAAGTREIMADALASLGESQGFETLRSICSASASAPYLKLAAAQSALRLHDESCVDSLLGLIRSEQASSPWSPARDNIVHVGLSGLGGFEFHHLTGAQEDEIRAIATGGLASTAAEVRLAAARAMAKFGDAASVPVLQKAVGTEQDQFNRPRMLEALKLLEDRRAAARDGTKYD